MDKARVGFDAWRRGDFSALEELLDPSVELLSWEPGEWDCHGRDQVLRLLHHRYEQGFAGGEMELIEAGDNKVISVSYPAEVGGSDWPKETATLIDFRDDKAVHMQQYRTRAEALHAANGPQERRVANVAGTDAKLLNAATVLLVENIARSLAYYRDGLGFEIDHYGTLPDHYGYAQRDSCSIHFANFKGARLQPNSQAVPPDMFDVHIHVDDVEALYEELVRRGAEIVHAPVNQGYGIREFRVRDPDGYVLAFGRPTEPNPNTVGETHAERASRQARS